MQFMRKKKQTKRVMCRQKFGELIFYMCVCKAREALSCRFA